MYSISTVSIGAAHLAAVQKVISSGIPGVTEDGEYIVRLKEPLSIHVSDPLHGYNKFVNSPYGCKFDEVYEGKVIGITPMKHDGLDPVYTYGNRIRDYPQPTKWKNGTIILGDDIDGCELRILGDGDLGRLDHHMGYDQLYACVDKLRANPNTRRAVMSTWVPYKDHKSHDPPCIMTICLEVVEDALTLVAFIRSNDMLMAWGENAIGLTAIQHFIAHELKLPVGYLETISRNAHVYYKRDQTDLRTMGIMYEE